MFKEQIVCLRSTDSTNSEILRNIDKLSHGAVCRALFQTSGKGQIGNSWESEDGKNLCFSLLLKPKDLKVQDQFVISQCVSVAICSYLNTLGLSAKIKWPNDIYIGLKKICGILIENHYSSSTLSYSIVGIGLNVNQLVFTSDAPNPTSVMLELSKKGETSPLNLEEELDHLLDNIEWLYNTIKPNDHSICRYTYDQLLYGKEKLLSFYDMRKPDKPLFDGKITGVSNLGRLVIDVKEDSGISNGNASGNTFHSEEFAFKEIKFYL